MSGNAIVATASGTLFGIIVGWILGSQAAAPGGPPAAALPAAAVAAPATPGAAPSAVPGGAVAQPVDMQRAAALERQANAAPGNATVRTELGNLYFDANRFDLAIPWYQASLSLNPRDVNVSTDLAVSFYSTNQVERALAQIDTSLAIDPAHLKTLLNQGIIRAFGKQDLAGAAASWERVVALAPGADEGQRAQQGLDGIRSAHAGAAPGSGSR